MLQGRLRKPRRRKTAHGWKRPRRSWLRPRQDLEAANAKLAQATQYYEVEYDHKQVRLTHEGEKAAQDIAGIGSFYTGANMEWPHLIEQSLRAHVVFEREKDYVVNGRQGHHRR